MSGECVRTIWSNGSNRAWGVGIRCGTGTLEHGVSKSIIKSFLTFPTKMTHPQQTTSTVPFPPLVFYFPNLIFLLLVYSV